MLKQRTIFWFWLPLAFSFMLMIFEGPWIQGVISRQDDAALQLAAFGVVVGLAVLIETPVINFLAVGSALAHDRQSYEVLSRYVLIINILLTILSLLFAFTPLLDLYLGGILDIPPELIAEARPAMVVLVPWTWFIGYRRFHQGILINHGRTNTITVGTFIRIIASAGVALGLGLWGGVSGAVIGAWSLLSAVFIEMIYVHVISRSDVEKLKSKERSSDKPHLTLQGVMRFHLPLAATALMSWFILPMTQRGLAQGDNAVEVLAAYPVIFSIMMVMRAGGIAWQEVVIALNKSEEHRIALRKFTLWLGFGTSTLMIVFSISPLITIYLRNILDVPENLIPLIITGSIFASFMPLGSTLQSYFRALLMGEDNTNPIYQAMMLGFIITITTLWLGLWLGIPAIPTAVIALSIGVASELIYLWRSLNHIHQKVKFKPILET